MSNAASGKECLIVGEVRAGRITVGATGRIEGRMVAEELELHGYASDFLSVSRRLAVRATATVVGTISYRTIEIEGGASIRGKLEQQGSGDGATPVPAAPTVRAEDAADDATAEAGS